MSSGLDCARAGRCQMQKGDSPQHSLRNKVWRHISDARSQAAAWQREELPDDRATLGIHLVPSEGAGVVVAAKSCGMWPPARLIVEPQTLIVVSRTLNFCDSDPHR